MGLVTEYPGWFVLLCILLGAVFSGALYFRAKAEISLWLLRLLALLRFLAVFLISFLLLSPLVRQRVRTIEKPVIIIGTDNSQSIAMGKDSVYYKHIYPSRLSEMTSRLEQKYEVRTFTFGEKVREGVDTGFSDQVTNLSAFFSETEKRFTGRNVGAVIVASDGIYNQGLNPLYAARRISWPVYAIVMGDTVQKRDIMVRKVTFNRQAFLGDRFPIEILVDALKCNGEKGTIKVTKGTGTVAEIPFVIRDDRYSNKFSVQIEAREKGLQHYTITVSPVDGEFTAQNNRQDIFIEVIDERQKIAILYDGPHPDISALRQALESGIRFEVTESEVSQFTDAPGKFDLIILYQVPSVSGTGQVDRLMDSETSLLFILGTRSDLFAFNKLQTGLSILSQKLSYTESQPMLNMSFPLFTIEREMGGIISQYPPLLSPFGTYQSSPLSDILLYQKIGNVTSQMPMAVFFKKDQRKFGIITGENLWRWRLSDFSQKGNHDAFDELIGKIAMYLSVKGDKSFFRVEVKNTIPENEPVEFSATVYNESYEPVNDPEVSLIVRDANGKSFPFIMSRSGNDYYLNAGSFPAGDYQWDASVMVGNNKYAKTGQFVIAPINLEALSVVADRQLMSQIAASHDGTVTTPDDMKTLTDQLLSRRDIASVSHYSKRFSDLAGNIWLFLLILALLAVEWAVRKRSGM